MRYSDDDGGGPGDWEPAKESPKVTITGAHQAVERPSETDPPPEASLDDWSFVRGTSPDPELPHWTEAPTGQVPAVLARSTGDTPSDDDPWSALPAPSWREDETDWTAQEERFEPAMLGDEGGTAPVHGDDDDARRPWEFDGEEAAATTAAVATTTAPATRVRARNSRARRRPPRRAPRVSAAVERGARRAKATARCAAARRGRLARGTCPSRS